MCQSRINLRKFLNFLRILTPLEKISGTSKRIDKK